MQSLVLTDSGLRIADNPIPPVMPGEVRIEIRSVGICSTDLAIWRGEYSVDLPLILGHEISGVIHESTVPDLEPGTHVTSEVFISCGNCWYCKRGLKHFCKSSDVLGVTIDGGMAEFLSVPADNIHVLPDEIDDISGTFIEPLSSAIRTRELVPAEKNEIVVILGSGKLGILLAQVYDAAGADVFLVGKNKWQLGLARKLGLRNTINIYDVEWKEKIMNLTNGIGPRVVIEATGSIEGIKNALDIVRSRGVISVKSTHSKSIALNPTDIVRREITIVGTGIGRFERAIDALAKGRIEVKSLVSKMLSLDEGPDAFEYAMMPQTMKVILNV